MSKFFPESLTSETTFSSIFPLSLGWVLFTVLTSENGKVKVLVFPFVLSMSKFFPESLISEIAFSSKSPFTFGVFPFMLLIAFKDTLPFISGAFPSTVVTPPDLIVMFPLISGVFPFILLTTFKATFPCSSGSTLFTVLTFPASIVTFPLSSGSTLFTVLTFPASIFTFPLESGWTLFTVLTPPEAFKVTFEVEPSDFVTVKLEPSVVISLTVSKMTAPDSGMSIPLIELTIFTFLKEPSRFLKTIFLISIYKSPFTRESQFRCSHQYSFEDLC